MTDKGKLVYERLKKECIPDIHKLSLFEKYQILSENEITTNLPHSFWENISKYYTAAEWDVMVYDPFPEKMESKHYLFLKYRDDNVNQIEYFSVLYIQKTIYAEMGYYDISNFESLVSDAIERSNCTGKPLDSNIDIIQQAYCVRNIKMDEYKRDVVTYSVRNPVNLEETMVSAEQLKKMIKAVNISEKDIEPPKKSKQGAYER